MDDSHISVAPDGSVTLPPAVARAYGLTPGAQARIDQEADGFFVRRSTSHLARIYIELTNACNIDCRTCMRNVWDLNTGFLSEELFEKIRGEVAAMPEKPLIFSVGLANRCTIPKP